ncbi:MAG: MltA domain-containing protein [Hydrogenophaga sp.]|nr:MltA domain-containing protein [Hydrogenophaga sp.]
MNPLSPHAEHPARRRASALWLALAATLGGCAGAPRQAIVLPTETVAAPAAPAPATSAVAATPSTTAPAPAAAPRPPVASSTAGEAQTFVTAGARYSLQPFADVPGWRDDNMVETWPAFLESCGVKARTDATWKALCERAARVRANNRAEIAAFFEREFAAYRIQDASTASSDGVVTGYFETLLQGSRRYQQPYIHPVYATPEDMVILDARRVSAAQRRQASALARVQGRTVTLQTTMTTQDLNSPGAYLIDLTALNYTALDKKIRLRADGRRLVPYYTREEIERLGAPNAAVIAFVNDPVALYETQIQGSGRIQLTDGSTIRVSFAEQNGHAFKPTLTSNSKVKLRGGEVELDIEDEDEENGVLRTRGFKLATLNTPTGRTGTAARTPAGPARITDPSYVFFRENKVADDGPIGAMGVPLTAQRSIAVDPRATPLGFPVFISTREPGQAKPLRRLTVAQDTGGAIRGVARADYFFGFGTQARNSARRMKERGQMWVLLPRGFKVSAVDTSVRLRGAPPPSPDELPDCLVDDGFCSNAPD